PAEHAPAPPERRDFVHALAQRLVVWPVDGRHVNADEMIANCEAALRLPLAEPVEIRLAVAPAPIRASAPPPADDEQRQPQSPEPRRLAPLSGMRISDE